MTTPEQSTDRKRGDTLVIHADEFGKPFAGEAERMAQLLKEVSKQVNDSLGATTGCQGRGADSKVPFVDEASFEPKARGLSSPIATIDDAAFQKEETPACEQKGSLTKQAGYSTDMKSSIDKLPEDFDYQPESVAKIAMLDNPSHPDMIGECRKTLVNAGIPEDRIAIFDASFLIREARGKSMLAQRTAMNSFWRVQLAKIGTDGYGARQLLIESGNDQDWHNWFRKLPLDVILKHELPRAEGASS